MQCTSCSQSQCALPGASDGKQLYSSAHHSGLGGYPGLLSDAGINSVMIDYGAPCGLGHCRLDVDERQDCKCT